jgi:hypothetical protein
MKKLFRDENAKELCDFMRIYSPFASIQRLFDVNCSEPDVLWLPLTIIGGG